LIILPNLILECDDAFWKQMTVLVLQQSLSTWQPDFPILLIIDEPWGCAFRYLETAKEQTTVVITRSPSSVYWDDLALLCPNILLAGEQSPESLFAALKLAQPQQSLNLTPNHSDSKLTLAEIKVLRHLARIKRNKQIAIAVGTEERAVANHLTSIYLKLEVRGREEAMFCYWGMLEMIKALD
jgi:DNA-binding CsgD family transcriptional regulator